MSFVRDLDTPLLRLSPNDVFSLRDGCAGAHVFGGIGAGKTSGAGRMISGAYLRAGFGGLVTAVKPEEVELWKRYAREHGRERSLILFDENEGFNFLSYELSRQGMDGIGTVVECLMKILEAAKKLNPTATHRSGEAFWDDAARSVLRYSILPLYAAYGTLSIAEILRFLNAAPKSRQEVTDPDWQKRSLLFRVIDAATRSPKVPMPVQALRDAIEFWSEEFPNIPDKTRGNIVITVSATLDRFKHGRLQRAFCGATTIVPELSFHGAVIVLAMPTLTWNEDGVIAQQLFKYMWMRSVLGRNALGREHQERPVFLWSDEAQETVNSYDFEFQSMCRGSRCCTVYLTQSLPTYYAKIGGDNPRDTALALVGKFGSQIFHSNSCAETNEYAARTIGKIVKRHANYSAGVSQSANYGMSKGESENYGTSWNFGSSSGSSGGHGNFSTNSSTGGSSGSGYNWGSNKGESRSDSESRGFTEAMEYAVEPGDFARVLKTGGRPNGNLVTAFWFQSGRRFNQSGRNFLLETFRQ
ncbi:MAG TPA: hypothetical protein VMI06_02610 [Terriglobia bacterium]|nr:hypothetical protein [Terriglobia bacterium]